MSSDFIPVIVGTDINTYLTGVCFHQEYGIRPYLLGRDTMGVTQYSAIFERIRYDAGIEDPDGLVAALRAYAEEIPHEGRPLVLVGTSDKYVRLIVENRDRLEDLYRMNVPSPEINAALQDKHQFYALAEKHGLPIPETHFHQAGDPLDVEISRYPVIVKPSNGIEYFRNPFPGQEKVYRVDDDEQLRAVVERIAAGGYRDQLIIQDFIPGDDTAIWDSVLYLNSSGRAEFVTFGQVALQEHTATAVGNYTAIVSHHDRPMMEQLVGFLEEIGYTGFANADLKWDYRDGEYKVLEFNTRQGRSSYYATQLGHNLARYLVDDVVHARRKELSYVDGEVLFTVVPRYILRRYVTDETVAADVRRLIRSGRWMNPLWYRGDKHLKRRAFLLMRGYRYAKKYRESTWIREGDADAPPSRD